MNGIPEKNKEIFEKYLKIIGKYLENKENPRLLDIGCANGNFISVAQELIGAVPYGVDVNQGAIDNCRRITENVSVYNLDDQLDIFKFESVKFDIITCFDVIEHLNNFNNLENIIRQNLKDDGLLMITTPNANALERFVNKNYSGEYDSSHKVLFTPYTLDFFLRRRGFKKNLLYTPYIFMFFPNLFNRFFKYGGQILGIYKK